MLWSLDPWASRAASSCCWGAVACGCGRPWGRARAHAITGIAVMPVVPAIFGSGSPRWLARAGWEAGRCGAADRPQSGPRFPAAVSAIAAAGWRDGVPHLGDLAAHHGLVADGRLIASVERKSMADLVASLTSGKLRYALAELAALPRAAVVVEDRYSQVFRLDRVRPALVADGLAELQVRWPNVPVVFCETRQLAEEWTDVSIPGRRVRLGARRPRRTGPRRHPRAKPGRRWSSWRHLPRARSSGFGRARTAWPSRAGGG